MKQDIASRLNLLRSQMAAHKVDATVIPQTDPHQSEYIADHWQLPSLFQRILPEAPVNSLLLLTRL